MQVNLGGMSLLIVPPRGADNIIGGRLALACCGFLRLYGNRKCGIVPPRGADNIEKGRLELAR